MTSDEKVMRSMETMLKIYMDENRQQWWALWDMLWGWLGTEIERQELWDREDERYYAGWR